MNGRNITAGLVAVALAVSGCRSTSSLSNGAPPSADLPAADGSPTTATTAMAAAPVAGGAAQPSKASSKPSTANGKTSATTAVPGGAAPGTAAPNAPTGDGPIGPAPNGGSGPASRDASGAPVPPNATLLIHGSNGAVEWRLYAYHDDQKRTCLLEDENTTSTQSGGGGGGGTCGQKLPLDASGGDSTRGRFVWGIVTAKATTVRIDHTGAASETFQVVGASGFVEDFYLLPVSNAPISQIVALDANGKVVATDNNTTALNTAPPA
jgi:hypothetical protein